MSIIQELEQKLKGWPDTGLTVLLVVYGLVFIIIGLYAPRTLKLATGIYAIL